MTLARTAPAGTSAPVGRRPGAASSMLAGSSPARTQLRGPYTSCRNASRASARCLSPRSSRRHCDCSISRGTRSIGNGRVSPSTVKVTSRSVWWRSRSRSRASSMRGGRGSRTPPAPARMPCAAGDCRRIPRRPCAARSGRRASAEPSGAGCGSRSAPPVSSSSRSTTSVSSSRTRKAARCREALLPAAQRFVGEVAHRAPSRRPPPAADADRRRAAAPPAAPAAAGARAGRRGRLPARLGRPATSPPGSATERPRWCGTPASSSRPARSTSARNSPASRSTSSTRGVASHSRSSMVGTCADGRTSK